MGNEDRMSDCKSNQVIWEDANQFWLPKLFVWNVLELVLKIFLKIRTFFL